MFASGLFEGAQVRAGNACLVSGVFEILHKEARCGDWKESPGRRCRKPQSLHFLTIIELSRGLKMQE